MKGHISEKEMKSKGHLGFFGDYEYFDRIGAGVYKAHRSDVIMPDGYRTGRCQTLGFYKNNLNLKGAQPMPDYKKSYQAGKKHMIHDGDHLVADQLDEKEVDILMTELENSPEKPTCTECGSHEFVLIEITETGIICFDEHGDPIYYPAKEDLEAEIKCSVCRTPKKRTEAS